MNVSVFGLGYVGTVSAACLARDGHTVLGVDVNPHKVAAVNDGESPVIEPGLADLVAETSRAGRLRASTDAAEAVAHSDVSVICVGTPSNGNGSLHLTHVENVARDIGAALANKRSYHVVVVRSTVLPGTVESLVAATVAQASGKRPGEDFGVAMNPEFLREGTALADYDQPSQIVIGACDTRSGDVVEALYERIEALVVRTSIRSAEMVKYVCNAFHALKVSFANEIGSLCKAHGVDGHEVMDIFCQDRRLNISAAYLRPGFAFGGSCLPKDLRALVYQARRSDVEAPVLSAVLDSNQRQIARGIELVERTGCKRIGVFGLSFKAGTDDVRESPTVPLVETLVGRGYQVRVFDEIVRPDRLIGANKSFLQRELPHIATLMRGSIEEVARESDVLVLAGGGAEVRRVMSIAGKEQQVIDLVGVGRSNSQQRSENYEGIGW